jgi:hypothetical protein
MPTESKIRRAPILPRLDLPPPFRAVTLVASVSLALDPGRRRA